MEPKLQRRIQRYGWDLAASEYEPLWQAQLADAQGKLLDCARLAAGERVLDVACGTGLVSFEATRAVGAAGEVVGVDLSERMVGAARDRACRQGIANVRFERMDAERLEFPDNNFDVVLCSLGLMYMPDPERALREMHRVLRPGGRLAVAIWGDRAECGWASVFSIVDAEVSSEVCPLFFRLGQQDLLARTCAATRFQVMEQYRLSTVLEYDDVEHACDAAFVGGPVALAWSRFDRDAKTRARKLYAESIKPWRLSDGYRIPGEFVVIAATASAPTNATSR